VPWFPENLAMSSNHRILVAGSKPEACRGYRDLLNGMGWALETASGEKACRSALQATSFDIVVLDLQLGLDLLREIRGRAPAAHVIALPRNATVPSIREALEAGAFDCLENSCSAQDLQSAVEAALRARSDVVANTGRTDGGPEPEGGRGIRVKPELCYACLGCAVACAYENLGLPDDAPLSPGLLQAARLSVEAAGGYAVPLLCMQCSDAPCMSVCPAKALQRPDPAGPISAAAEKCIGCRRCMVACPMGVLTFDARSRVVQKCDLCIRRAQAGRKPACVASCPTDALELVEAAREQ
jgi:Fe-S-cluster-containing dehydrogenase component/CheY-like chemotaxis protein